MNDEKITFKIRLILVFFIIILLISGITAFPIEYELSFAVNHLTLLPEFLRDWISTVYTAIKLTNSSYPFISYGTDWLAFAHIVIAIAFIGPIKDPVRNIWVVQFGMFSCLLVIPLALIAGTIRAIPFYWQLIDCSFGVFGLVPLIICYRNIRKLEKIRSNQQ